MHTPIVLAQSNYRAPDLSQALAGGTGMVVTLLLLILGVLWFLFPFIVYSKFNELIRETKRNGEALERIERNTAKPADTAASSSVRYSMEEPSSIGAMIAGILAVVILIGAFVAFMNRR